jgi:hypothetical protein
MSSTRAAAGRLAADANGALALSHDFIATGMSFETALL